MRNIVSRIFALGVFCMAATGDAADALGLDVGRIIPVCTVMDDAFVALSNETQSNLSPTNQVLGNKVCFNRTIGLFHDAVIKEFSPPVPLLNHGYFAGGQIESIASTSVVTCATFDSCKGELMRVKSAFEKYKIGFCEMASDNAFEYGFKTERPTWGGWNIILLVRKLNENTFASSMTLFRVRPEGRRSSPDVLIDVDI